MHSFTVGLALPSHHQLQLEDCTPADEYGEGRILGNEEAENTTLHPYELVALDHQVHLMCWRETLAVEVSVLSGFFGNQLDRFYTSCLSQLIEKCLRYPIGLCSGIQDCFLICCASSIWTANLDVELSKFLRMVSSPLDDRDRVTYFVRSIVIDEIIRSYSVDI